MNDQEEPDEMTRAQIFLAWTLGALLILVGVASVVMFFAIPARG